MTKKRILFSGYAPVHFLCFQPIYERLRSDPQLDVYLSGGFREKGEGDEVSYELDGFYDAFDVDRDKIIPVEQTAREDFDVVVCSHTSDLLFPRSAGASVQIFHGVSFKNLLVRDKALRYDYVCLPGAYHAERYLEQGLVRDGATKCLVTGFAKADALVDDGFDRADYFRRLELSPERPTLLLAPTGEKHNALETMGQEVIEAIAADDRYNLLIKPHDHPKKSKNWFVKLARHESRRVKLIRDKNIVPSLRAADLLMTDASSVAVEYTLLDRPILFLDVPEMLEALQTRAPALDLETYGRKIGDVVAGPGEVIASIECALAEPGRHGELRRKMAAHVFHEPGGAAGRAAAVVRHAAGLAALPDDIETLSPARGAA